VIEYFFLDIVEESIKDSLPHLLMKHPLEACLTHFGFEDFDTEQYIGKVNYLLNTATTIDFPHWKASIESLSLTSSIPAIPSPSRPSSTVDHLPRIILHSSRPISVHDSFPDEKLIEITKKESPWYADIGNYLAIGKTLYQLSKKVKDRFFKHKGWLFNFELSSRWDDPLRVTSISPHKAVELRDPKTGNLFKVNDQRLKPYIEGTEHTDDVESVDLADPIYLD
jgi:hypothetical protein